MQIERGMAGDLPYAAVGSGPAIVICSGLWPTTGVSSRALVRGSIAPLRKLIGERRLVVLNRRPGLPAGMTMGQLAGEYADAIRDYVGAPVDIVGSSTGGSIAQQLAADHPDVVRRLVLLSSACRLGPVGRDVQARVAAQLRAQRIRSAAGVAAGSLAPHGFRLFARGLGWIGARRVLTDAMIVRDLAVTLEAEDQFDLARCARPIEAKTLIVAGGRDRFYSRELFRETAALIPNSLLRIFPRHGHASVTSDPRVQATIVGFLPAP